MRKFRLLLLISLLGPLKIFAQHELTFYNMDAVFQSSYFNPSSKLSHTVSIGLPGMSAVSVHATNTGFSYGDFYQKGYYRGDTVRGNVLNAYRQLKDQNYFQAGASTDLFHVRIKVRKMSFALFSQVVVNTRVSYPKSLMDLLVNGNSGKLGQDIDISGLAADFNAYRTIGLGITRDFRKFRIGANIKYINGLNNMSLDAGNDLKLRFDPNYYDIHVSSNMTASTSGLEEKTTNSKGETIYKSKEPDYDLGDLSQNPGLALDLGATYDVADRLRVSASVLNIGSINWKNEVVNRNISGGLDFKGFDVFSEFVRGGGTTDSSLAREFENSFKYSENNNAYRRRLTPQFYLGLQYDLSPKTTLGLLANLEKYKKTRAAYSLSLHHKFSRVFSLIGSYNIRYQRYDNVGIGFVLKLGPVQLYAASDNLVVPLARTISSGFQITKEVVDPIKTLNLRFGLNLVFGKVNGTAAQTYNQHSF